MPKIVDKDQKRIEIADAALRIIATRGLEHVSMRTVAQEAGVSSVQYYFSSKTELLKFSFTQQNVRAKKRIEQRLRAIKNPTPKRILKEALCELLPFDQERRQLSLAILAYTSYVATGNNSFLSHDLSELEQWFSILIQTSNDVMTSDIADTEARSLLLLVDGLRSDLLLQTRTPDQAKSIIAYHIDRVCQ